MTKGTQPTSPSPERHPDIPIRLMKFPAAVAHDPAIDAWFSQRGELGLLARRWFDLMRACGPDVRELLHDQHPTACVGDAAFAYTNVFKAHVNVGFFLAAGLPDPAGLLVGTGKFMRHVKLSPDARIDEDALAEMIRSAYISMKELNEAQ